MKQSSEQDPQSGARSARGGPLWIRRCGLTVQSAARRSATALGRCGEVALDLYAPQLCLFCALPSQNAVPLCDSCRDALPLNLHACPHCALPGCGGSLCPDCQSDAGLPCRVIAPFIYNRDIAHLMQRWKFDKQRRLVSIAAQLCLMAVFDLDPDTVPMATPLHWRRRLMRGFNQSDDLLRALTAGSPPLKMVRAAHDNTPRLTRCRSTPKQSRANRRERQRNLENAFRVHGDLRGRPVLVVDDVCTTGATASAITHALRAAGAGEVSLWCVARTPRH